MVAIPAQVQAQGDPKATAREYFKSGQEHFKANDFESALLDFQNAHKLHPHPDILFMVAQALRNLKLYHQAIKGFKDYLKAKPEAQDRVEVTRLIEELEFLAEVSGQQKPVKKPVKKKPVKKKLKPLAKPHVPKVPRTPTPVKKKTQPVYKTWWFWAAIAGGAAVAGGVGYGIYYATSDAQAPAGALGNLDLRP